MALRVGACTAGLIVAVFAIAAGPSSGTTRVRQLRAWASAGKKPPVGVTTSPFSPEPRVTRHLPPGVYRVGVIASESLGFQLVGPGVDRHTRVTLYESAHSYSTNTTWTIRLKRGLYQYRAIGPDASGLSTVTRVTGSFRVP